MAEGKVNELAHTDPKGDPPSHEELLVHVYDELRRLAANYLRSERADHTLQPTALVHEAYLRARLEVRACVAGARVNRGGANE